MTRFELWLVIHMGLDLVSRYFETLANLSALAHQIIITNPCGEAERRLVSARRGVTRHNKLRRIVLVLGNAEGEDDED